MKAAVIGAGSWGTAIAQVLGSKGMDVCLWARRDDVVDGINRDHHNPRYLSDSPLADTVSATSSYPAVLEGADAVVVVTPSYLVRDVGSRLSGLIGDDTPVIICSKGIEEGTGDLPIAQMEQEIGNEGRIAVLSGPNHAEEVIRALPAATVIAGSDEQTVTFFRDLFATEQFRTYTSHDPVGVRLQERHRHRGGHRLWLGLRGQYGRIIGDAGPGGDEPHGREMRGRSADLHGAGRHRRHDRHLHVPFIP